ncbi:MAG: hypothetical protein K9J17_02530 [Flavobacteriales bacterium]|nr:hypothetical protein [Flavobacteriales bacterium]
MRIIDRDDIKAWGKSFGSKGQLPVLLAKLSRATSGFSTRIHFPSGSAVTTSGFDGIVDCTEEHAYVPEGRSIWEFGTEPGPKTKAQEDYDKRTTNPRGQTLSKCTFVFVTTEPWVDKDVWIEERKADGVWEDIRVLNCNDLEEWIDLAPAVGREFYKQVTGASIDDILTAEESWREFSTGPYKLSCEMLTAGRLHDSTQIDTFLAGNPGILAIKASSRDEAIAFIIASAFQFSDTVRSKAFFHKCLVVSDPRQFRQMAKSGKKLNLVANFEDYRPIYTAVEDGHHVLVPLGADDNFNPNPDLLPLLDGVILTEELVKLGIDYDQARRFIKESANNITLLKERLGFPPLNVDWNKAEFATDLLAALIVGKWNEESSGDKKILETISGLPYEQYVQKLSRWKSDPVPPIIQIGSTWRISSPLIVWRNLAEYISHEHMVSFKKAFEEVLLNNKPIEVDVPNHAFTFFSREYMYSSDCREGLCQSMILVALYGVGLKLFSDGDSQSWVDEIVAQMLDRADSQLWISLDRIMPLIAEASPESFIQAVLDSLNSSTQSIMGMFEEVDGIISPNSHHTGLLWALEGLAWMPEYISDVAIILAKLAALDPGGNLANRPDNSLREIFKPWHIQTFTSQEDRLVVLNRIADSVPEVGWKLLVSLLPKFHDMGQPTHKPRWRMFEKSFKVLTTYEELYSTHTRIVKLLIDRVGKSEDRIANLLEESDNLAPADRAIIIKKASELAGTLDETNHLVWHTLRKHLSHHRSHPDAKWALSEADLQPYAELYTKYSPGEGVDSIEWLFAEHGPSFADSKAYDSLNFSDSHKEREERISQERIKALNALVESDGFDSIKELKERLEDGWYLGQSLAQAYLTDKQEYQILEEYLGIETNDRFISGYIFHSAREKGTDWVTRTFEQLEQKGLDPDKLVSFLISVESTPDLWKYINSLKDEVVTGYWKHMRPVLHELKKENAEYQLNKLILVQRHATCIQVAFYHREHIPTKVIFEVLHSAGSRTPDEAFGGRSYEIEQLFTELDVRGDIERDKLIQLELLYLPVLESYGNNRNLKTLHEELSSNAESFITVLSWLYKPESDEQRELEVKDVDDKTLSNRSMAAYRILSSWKLIPGKTDDGVAEAKLIEWIEQVREQAKACSRLDVADSRIGEILAEFPQGKFNGWLPDGLCKKLEGYESESILRGLSRALYNQRGSSSRGVYAGGEIERGHADYFLKLEEYHQVKYPKIASVFRQLRTGYLKQAKKMDDEAVRNQLD